MSLVEIGAVGDEYILLFLVFVFLAIALAAVDLFLLISYLVHRNRSRVGALAITLVVSCLFYRSYLLYPPKNQL